MNEPTEKEMAEALGFESVEQMNEHQRWLESQAAHTESVRQAIKNARVMNGAVYYGPFTSR